MENSNCSSIGVKYGGGINSLTILIPNMHLNLFLKYIKIGQKNVLINNLRIGMCETKINNFRTPKEEKKDKHSAKEFQHQKK